MDQLLARFFHYLEFDSQFNFYDNMAIKREEPFIFIEFIQQELENLGLTDITLDHNGYLMANLPANVDWFVPKIGFIVNINVSHSVNKRPIQPQIIEEYRGGDIALGIGHEVLSPVTFPILHQLIGKSLITGNGIVPLNLDNKSTIAEVITMLDYLISKDCVHGDVGVVFVPDNLMSETPLFDITKFAAQWAYQLEAGELGAIVYNNYNLAEITLHCQRIDSFRHTEKIQENSALTLAIEFHHMLARKGFLDLSEQYSGFCVLQSLQGNLIEATMRYNIGHFERKKWYEYKQQLITMIVQSEQQHHHNYRFHYTTHDIHYNMKDSILSQPQILTIAKQAIQHCDLLPLVLPISHNKINARLTNKGLACPSLFLGGHNLNSIYEFITIEEMEKGVDILKTIITLTAEIAKVANRKQITNIS